MNNFKNQIVSTIKEQGVIAIIRGVEDKNIPPLLDALYLGGLKVAEITFGWLNDNETVELIQEAVNFAGDRLFIGAGTVTSLKRAELAYEAGAKFVVAPNVNREVIEFCNQKGICVISGAFSPTEICNARLYGADFIKIFPANVLGAEYFKAMKAPFGDIPLLAFAGVTCDNIGEYLSAGAIGAGIGSELINLKAIKTGDFAYVTNKAKALLSAVKAVK